MRRSARMHAANPWVCAAMTALIVCLLVGCEGDSGPLGEGHNFGVNDPNLYLAMGDSITAAGWPGILAGKLGSTVINYSTGGARSDAGAAAVNGQLQRHPGFLLILYGANDVINGHDPSATIENLRYMIRAAKANQTIPVIGTVTPMRGPHQAYDQAGGELSSRIRSLAHAEGAALADVRKAFGNGEGLLRSDGLHPTPAGSEKIASVFYSVLR